MGYPQDAHTGNNSTVDFAFTFPYLKESDIKVSVDGTDKTLTTDYTLHNATTIRFNSAPDVGERIRIYRDTGSDKLSATFYPGSAIRSGDLNDNYTQNLYVTQEGEYDAADAKDYAIRFCIEGDGSNTTGTEKDADISVRPPKPKGVPYAVTQSESAVTTSTAANTKSDNAVTTANAAQNTVNTYVHDGTNPAGDGVGNNPKGVAYAINTADDADSTATTASNNASSAVTTANTASTNATSALNNSRRSDGSGGWASAIDVADAADTKATTASNNASTAVTTANAATATANSASSTASTASTNATAAKLASDRVVATTSDGGSTWTLAGNNTNASTDPKGVGYAVTKSETADTNATAALDNSREADGSGGWTSAISIANTASTTSTTATTNANTAKMSTDRLVATTSDGGSTWTLTGNNTDASTDPKGVGYAVTTAEAAESAVANAVLYSPKGTTALWAGGTYTEDDFIEIADSSGLEAYNTGTTPKLSGLPADFEGAEGLTVRLQYTHSNTTFTYKSYFANDSEDRYMGIKRGYIPSAPAAGQKNYFVVKVATKNSFHRYNGTGASNGYTIDGQMAPFLELVPGVTYRFDQSDSSNAGHTLKFYEEADKTTLYSTGVTVNGTAGSSGAYTQIVTTDTLPTVLHYMCDTHAHMGNAIQNNTAFDRTTMPIIDAGDFSLTSSHAAVATTYDGGAFT